MASPININPNRLLVCGARSLTRVHVPSMVEQFSSLPRQALYLAHGNAAGADRLSHTAAVSLWGFGRVAVTAFSADWKAHGRAAGPMRNQRMLVEFAPTYWMAFHTQDDLGLGTSDMVSRLKRARIPGRVVLLADSGALRRVLHFDGTRDDSGEQTQGAE